MGSVKPVTNAVAALSALLGDMPLQKGWNVD
jgi:hypothetical protein